MSRTKKDRKLSTINPNDIPSRDYLMMAIINGITKASTHRDRRKDRAKYRCRDRGDRDWD